jgi:serine phosphatase RsbU (regulator of sigma subunit)
MKVVKVIGAEPDAWPPEKVTAAASQWIASVKRESVSKYLKLPDAGAGGGAHLVCVPMRGPGGLMMVAVVPVSSLETNLLSNVNRSASTGAILVDHSGTFISSSEPQAVGHKYTELKNPRTLKLAEQYVALGRAGTEIFDRSEQIGDVTLKPGMSTIQPISVLGQRWFLIISSDLGDVDKLVTPVFKDAMLWAAFVMLAMTGILVSTAIQMIRSRVRMERFRHDVLSRELQQAREIQIAWLPDNEDDPPNIDLSAINEPASHISGDFYNWFQLCDGRTCVVIGDVTGHGMAAAFLMATTQLLVRTTMPRVNDPAACLEEVNRQLCVQVFNGQFVTMLILVLDVENGAVEVATAGHPPPLVGEGESFRALEFEPQLMLGVDRDAQYVTERFKLAKGSSIVLYTDGVPDALNLTGERFRISGLARSLYGKYERAHAIVEAVVNAVNNFRGTSELADDLTLVAVQLQHAAAPRASRASAHLSPSPSGRGPG